MDGTAWPTGVADCVRLNCGEPLACERLGGLSAARVYRVRGPRGSAIVKAHADPREVHVYARVAPALRQAAIAVPRSACSALEGGVRWLVLEDIPRPLPRSRWGADPEVVAVLARLHELPLVALPNLPDPFRPAWADDLTAAALRGLPATVAAALAPRLCALQHASQPLFAPRCFITGDPNPTNWGVRDDGTVVLFDWERFGRGTPALDLALALPGLGNGAAFEQMAARYLAKRRRLTSSWPPAVASLTREIALAKAWSVVEFLGGPAASTGQRGEAIAGSLMAKIPAWIEQIVSVVERPAG